MPRRRVIIVAAAFIAASTFACGKDFLHTNPYDPDVPVTITLVGPETVFSYREHVTFRATSVPAFPDSAFQFTSSDSVSFTPSGPGTFSSNAPPLYPATRSVGVLVGVGAYDTTGANPIPGAPPVVIKQWRHTITQQIVLTQRVTNIALRCPDTHACGSLAAGGTWSVWVDGTDALGQPIVALTSSVANPATGIPVATFAVRDPVIASLVPAGIRVATVTALKTGTTWIVATRGTLTDSLQITVR